MCIGQFNLYKLNISQNIGNKIADINQKIKVSVKFIYGMLSCTKGIKSVKVLRLYTNKKIKIIIIKCIIGLISLR